MGGPLTYIAQWSLGVMIPLLVLARDVCSRLYQSPVLRILNSVPLVHMNPPPTLFITALIGERCGFQ